MSKSLVDKKIELIKDVFQELEDEGYQVYVISGQKKFRCIYYHRITTSGDKNSVLSPQNLIFVYIRNMDHNLNFTEFQQKQLSDFMKYSMSIIPKWRGSSSGSKYYCCYFNK